MERMGLRPQTMFGTLLTEAEADAIYSVLVDEAGAREEDRSNFISNGMDPKRGFSEWRFIGALGFGGKAHYGPVRGFYVTAYPEDLNDVRRAIIERVNEKLARLATDAKGSSDD